MNYCIGDIEKLYEINYNKYVEDLFKDRDCEPHTDNLSIKHYHQIYNSILIRKDGNLLEKHLYYPFYAFSFSSCGAGCNCNQISDEFAHDLYYMIMKKKITIFLKQYLSKVLDEFPKSITHQGYCDELLLVFCRL